MSSWRDDGTETREWGTAGPFEPIMYSPQVMSQARN